MKILYIGSESAHSTSLHRALALKRLGHEMIVIDPQRFMPGGLWALALNVRTGYRFFSGWVSFCLRAQARRELRKKSWRAAELVWIDGCPELNASWYRWCARNGMPTLNYNVDDPFGTRDRRKWDQYKKTVPLHSVTVVVRRENIEEAFAAGAKRVVHVYRSYDPVAHAPVAPGEREASRWRSDVVFVGTWMPERGPFMVELLDRGVPLAIWGDSWQKAPEWERLRACWRGPAVYGREYVKAISGAKITLGLLSKGNRDLHTQRSAEVPFIGGAAFCAERTVEHEKLYRADKEALFWSSGVECAERCVRLLADEPRRLEMAAAAKRRVCEWRLSNDEVLAALLRVANGADAEHPLVTEAADSKQASVRAETELCRGTLR